MLTQTCESRCSAAFRCAHMWNKRAVVLTLVHSALIHPLTDPYGKSGTWLVVRLHSASVLMLLYLTSSAALSLLSHQDMTARDLLQQRYTLPNGDTAWRPAPLVTAAIEGKLLLLDGIHRVNLGTLAVLSRYLLKIHRLHRAAA